MLDCSRRSHQELAALIVAYHEIAQQNLPFLFIGAGLPQLAALAGNAKSYAERVFTYPQMGPLESAAAWDALVHPAQNQGVLFDDDAVAVAVAEVLRVTECYPYFLQEWGFQVWNAAASSPIRRIDVEQHTEEVRIEMRNDAWRSLWAALLLLVLSTS